MIEVKFSGANLDVLRRQMTHFLDEMDGPGQTVEQPVTTPVEEPVTGPFPVAAAKDEAPSTASPAADASGVTSAEPPSDVPDTTYDDTIKPRMLQLSLRKGREAVFKVLGTFDVPNVRDVPEDKWPELLALIDELLGS